MRKLYFLLYLSLVQIVVFAQPSVKVAPFSDFLTESEGNAFIPSVTVEGPNMETLSEDIFNNFDDCEPCKSNTYGKSESTNIDILKVGLKINLSDTATIYRYRVSSPNAEGLQFKFDNFFIKPGAYMHIYSPDKKHKLGAFSQINNKKSNSLFTGILSGEEAIVEFYEPHFPLNSNSSIYLSDVIHVYKDPLKAINGNTTPGEAYSDSDCMIDVNCDQDPWVQTMKKSVGMMLIRKENGYTIRCSGALINSTDPDKPPYFYSAQHCLSGSRMEKPIAYDWYPFQDEIHYDDVAIAFNYENTGCGTTAGNPPYENMQIIDGVTLKSAGRKTDYILLELDTKPELFYDVYYLGWDRRLNIMDFTNRLTGIHHANGDVKKICYSNTVVPENLLEYPGGGGSSNFEIDPATGDPVYTKDVPNALWELNWTQGYTFDGASGSPLITDKGRLIGALMGGRSKCSTGSTGKDWYGTLYKSWSTPFWHKIRLYHAAESSRFPSLGHFLSTGSLSTEYLDGYQPNPPHCFDDIPNFNETGIDCGGPCTPCSNLCNNGTFDGDETATDCGGSCNSCATQVNFSIASSSNTAYVGDDINFWIENLSGTTGIAFYDWSFGDADDALPFGSALDFVSNVTFAETGSKKITLTVTDNLGSKTITKTINIVSYCTDGIQNNGETGVDCGGSCSTCLECSDGQYDAHLGETGIDCGGPCRPCYELCDDGIPNGDELGIDCGGSCDPCPNCDDGYKNGNETGVDCGGTCRPCSELCNDNIQNGDEVLVDCGPSCSCEGDLFTDGTFDEFDRVDCDLDEDKRELSLYPNVDCNKLDWHCAFGNCEVASNYSDPNNHAHIEGYKGAYNRGYTLPIGPLVDQRSAMYVQLKAKLNPQKWYHLLWRDVFGASSSGSLCEVDIFIARGLKPTDEIPYYQQRTTSFELYTNFGISGEGFYPDFELQLPGTEFYHIGTINNYDDEERNEWSRHNRGEWFPQVKSITVPHDQFDQIVFLIRTLNGSYGYSGYYIDNLVLAETDFGEFRENYHRCDADKLFTMEREYPSYERNVFFEYGKSITVPDGTIVTRENSSLFDRYGVSLRATESIVFKAGSWIKPDVTLSASIGPCNTTSPLSEILEPGDPYNNSDNVPLANLISNREGDVNIEKINTDPSVFPNPSDGTFHVNLNNNDLSKIEIYDLSGMKIEEYNTVPQSFGAKWHQGLYIIRFFLDNKVITQKLEKL